MAQLRALLSELGRNLRDLLPIVCVIGLFQLVVIGEPMPDLQQRATGALLALVGLTLFVRGLDMSIFPLGDRMAESLARRGSLALLLAFGFALGFGSTVAEPALAAVTDQAASAVAHPRPFDDEGIARFSVLLRYMIAAGVGLAIAVGVLRLVKGWPATWLLLPGYALAAVLALASPPPLAAIAFDAGAAATSAINIPLMLALGLGLASMLRERNPLLDGFGFVALASLTPAIAILVIAFFRA